MNTQRVTIETVPKWLTITGIGHIVLGASGGWVSCACGHTFVVGKAELEDEIPPRICCKCRAALPKLTEAKC